MPTVATACRATQTTVVAAGLSVHRDKSASKASAAVAIVRPDSLVVGTNASIFKPTPTIAGSAGKNVPVDRSVKTESVKTKGVLCRSPVTFPAMVSVSTLKPIPITVENVETNAVAGGSATTVDAVLSVLLLLPTSVTAHVST